MIEWHKYVKKYCWDSDKTPYFVPVSQLKRDQADKELFLYSFILAAPATLYLTSFVVNLFRSGQVAGLAIAMYASSLFVCAIVVHVWKSPGAALYSLSAPIVLSLYFLIEGFPERSHAVDFAVMVAIAVVIIAVWLYYARRLLSITRAYPSLPTRDMNPWNKLPPGMLPPRK
ncbi:MAG: hypothetical protein O3B08_07565 [Proteobacteria bacterium]|jgi:hypothetical protein|nr:hypothetical protein [Pseudomonadota bacterium]